MHREDEDGKVRIKTANKRARSAPDWVKSDHHLDRRMMTDHATGTFSISCKRKVSR